MKIASITVAAKSVLVVAVVAVAGVQGQTPSRTICATSVDCDVEGGEYCSTVDGTCLMAGHCTAVEDCTDNMDNIFAANMCIGTMYCIEDAGNPGKCQNICDGTPSLCSAYETCEVEDLEAACCPDNENKFLACCAGIPNDDTAASVPEDDVESPPDVMPEESADDDDGTRTVCTTMDDCDVEGGEYCSTVDGTCLMTGHCTAVEDCTDNMDNNFAAIMCIGTMYCVEDAGNPGKCQNVCLGTPSECSAYPSCTDLDGACCPDAEGKFLACCVAEPEEIDTLPVEEEGPLDPGFAVDPPQFCTAATDCDTETEYCGQGTCIKNGMCIVNADCMNAANIILQDVKCIGYQYCNENQQCDRQCGEPCPFGVTPAECTVTGCDTKIMCPGAVSCTPDFCQDCKGMYFDATGAIIDDCGVTAVDDGSSSSSSSTAPTSDPQGMKDRSTSPPSSATEGYATAATMTTETNATADDATATMTTETNATTENATATMNTETNEADESSSDGGNTALFSAVVVAISTIAVTVSAM